MASSRGEEILLEDGDADVVLEAGDGMGRLSESAYTSFEGAKEPEVEAPEASWERAIEASGRRRYLAGLSLLVLLWFASDVASGLLAGWRARSLGFRFPLFVAATRLAGAFLFARTFYTSSTFRRWAAAAEKRFYGDAAYERLCDERLRSARKADAVRLDPVFEDDLSGTRWLRARGALSRLWSRHEAVLSACLVAALVAGDDAASVAALEDVSPRVLGMLRSVSAPLVLAAWTIAEGEAATRFDWRSFLLALGIVLGGALSGEGEVGVRGAVLGLLSSALWSGFLLCAERLTMPRGRQEPLQLVMNYARFACVGLLVLSAAAEGREMVREDRLFGFFSTLLATVSDVTLAFASQALLLAVLSRTSAPTCAVLASLESVLLSGTMLLAFGPDVSRDDPGSTPSLRYCGDALVLACALGYAACRWLADRRSFALWTPKTPDRPLPVARGDEDT